MDNNSFWLAQNVWWRAALLRMETKTTTENDWNEANFQLRSLLGRIPEASGLGCEDKDDIVQTMLLSLLDPGLRSRLLELDTPAHYLRTMVQHRLVNDWKRTRAGQRAMHRYCESLSRKSERAPDEEVEWQEWRAKARFIVNHIVSAADRKVLWWFYKDGLTAKEIGERLGAGEASVLQKLFRARQRVKREFET